MELVGPSSRGFTHLFTIVDRTSIRPVAVPLSLTSAVDCARALLSCWILRFGVPAKITSDCGAQFTSSLWGVMCSVLNISCSKTTSFHPQYIGLVERFHHSLKTSLQAHLAGPHWVEHFPLVMLDYVLLHETRPGSLPPKLCSVLLSALLGSSWILRIFCLKSSWTGFNLLFKV